MNTQNVASLEACKRLVDAGIVLETDMSWCLSNNNYEGVDKWELNITAHLKGMTRLYSRIIPAPSMAEVLKELPNNTAFLKNKIYYASTGGKDNAYKEFISTNPTDALIDLLIWTRKEKV